MNRKVEYIVERLFKYELGSDVKPSKHPLQLAKQCVWHHAANDDEAYDICPDEPFLIEVFVDGRSIGEFNVTQKVEYDYFVKERE